MQKREEDEFFFITFIHSSGKPISPRHTLIWT